ncbi:hypothetical protein C2845_PM04G09710 [Panicum miliaceum]|uniref:Transposase (putative) gypsy type domain-containing protein n=1 Tax=Panicum miliaceum TaxID=4540 RepID=A0A3L6QUX3_PANMI|nr:hypothetical protein C2845_PM04G09710 [Panicum miliaceum]
MSSWKKSIMSGVKIRLLEERGLHPPHSRWRPVVGEFFPRPTPTEAVALVEFFHQVFGISAHDFLCSVLGKHDIGLRHLHPEGILHLVVFVSLCEGFLGVALHLSLFHRLFVVEGRKAKPGDATSAHISGESLAVHPHLARDYPRVEELTADGDFVGVHTAFTATASHFEGVVYAAMSSGYAGGRSEEDLDRLSVEMSPNA